MANNKTVLGFDFGTKYTGIAVGQTVSNTAKPLTCIKITNHEPNWQQLDELIAKWQPDELVIGLPLNMDGSMQKITHQTIAFANKLQRYNLPVHQVDERLTTWEAKKYLPKEHYNSKELMRINAIAAAILLEQWLNIS